MPLDNSSPIWNIPNILTLMRIAAIPLLAILLLSPSKNAGFWAAALFAVASVTDWLDGYFARKYSQVTTLGRILDPFADKVTVCGTFIFLAAVVMMRMLA